MNRKEEKNFWQILPFKQYISSLKQSAQNKEIQKQWLKTLISGGLYGLGAFILSSGEMLFGTFPMGIALLCASTEHLWFLWAGGLAATLIKGDSSIIFAVIYSVALAFRLRLASFYKDRDRITGTKEPVGIKVVLSVVLAFSVGLYGCITEGFSVHALMALLFYLLSAGIFTFLYSGRYAGAGTRKLYKQGADAALLFSLVYGAGSFSFFSFSPAVALAALFCFLSAEENDLLHSAVLGIILGIACGKDYAPVLGLVGLVSGALYKYSKKTAPWLGILAGFSFSFYSKGSSSFLYVLPDLVCGLLFYLPLSAFRQKYPKEILSAARASEKCQATPVAPVTHAPVEESLDTLSQRLFALSGKLRLPEKEDADRICREGISRICSNCKAGCFKEEHFRKKLADTLFEVGRLDAEIPPPRLSSTCNKWELLCDNVNNDYTGYLRHLYEADRSDCYARCYKSISDLLKDREDIQNDEEGENEEVTKSFERALRRLSIGFEQCSTKGKRGIFLRAEGVNTADLGKSASEIQKMFEEKCGFALSFPELECTEGKTALMFNRREKFKAKFGAAAKCKEGEDYCGDTVYTFTQNHYFYALLCDGMGSGRDAALVSRISCHFLEQLSGCGGTLQTVLKTVNDFLLCQSCECSTTIDLMRLDLYDGTCDFVKCGACPSLVLRGGNTFKLSSASMPIGAAREVGCELITLHLRPGDRVLIMSDGVGCDIEGSAWLSSLLAGRLRHEVQELAEDILEISASEEQKPDDRSIAVIEIAEKE